MHKLSNKKILMVIARNIFRDEEYSVPRKILEDEGASITVASSTLDTATGKLGLRVKPDILLGDVQERDYDGIVFVGGGGSKEYFDSPVAHKLAQDFYNHGKLTSAICIAPAILANAGLLKGKHATSFPSSEELLKEKGAVFTYNNVVSDGTLVTADGPESAKKFAEILVEALQRI